MLSIKNVTRRYGNFVAVSDLSLSVQSGSIFGFIGPNGAGKTTTMKMVCGLIRPSEGTITVGGVDVVKDPLAVKAQIEAAKAPASNDCADLDATLKEAIALLKDLRTTIRKAEPEHLTDLMRSLVSRVELQFNHRPYGKLTRSEFKRGTVFMRPGVLGSQLSQKGALLGQVWKSSFSIVRTDVCVT